MADSPAPGKPKKEYTIFDIYWKDPKDKKSKWKHLGVITEEKGTGKIVLKMNVMPVGWNGYANVFERKAGKKKGEYEE